MATNVIKYDSTTGFISDTYGFKIGNFYIGTAQVEYGPTSTSNWWDGITPTIGGYTIYIQKASQGPSIYTPNNDGELIWFANYLGAGGVGTVEDALMWFYNNSTTYLVANRDLEDVISNSVYFVVYHLDFGYSACFPRSSSATHAHNMTIGYTADIVNGAFSTNAGGNILLDGTSSTIGINSGQGLSVKTFAIWVKLSDVTQSGKGVISYENYPSSSHFDCVAYDGTTNGWGFTSEGHIREQWSGIAESSPSWVYIVATYDDHDYRLYRNGSLILSTTSFPLSFSLGAGGARLIVGKKSNTSSGDFLYGQVGMVTVYNNILSPSQILDNYNATLPRYS